MMETASLGHRWNQLVDALVRSGTLRTPRIIAAFRAYPRSAFVPPTLAEVAVSLDVPLSIRERQTISQPTTVATMLERVQPSLGERVLDVGTGSGWQAALLAYCVRQRGSHTDVRSGFSGAPEEGTVVTIERIPELADAAATALDRAGVRNVVLLVGDAVTESQGHGPYDVIVSAAASRDVPPAWIEQLKPRGRLLHPIAGMGLRVLRKDQRGRVTAENHPGYVFVPLVSEHIQ